MIGDYIIRLGRAQAAVTLFDQTRLQRMVSCRTSGTQYSTYLSLQKTGDYKEMNGIKTPQIYINEKPNWTVFIYMLQLIHKNSGRIVSQTVFLLGTQ